MLSSIDLNSLCKDVPDLCLHANATLNCLISSSSFFLLLASILSSFKAFSFCCASVWDEVEILWCIASLSSFRSLNSLSKLWYFPSESSRSWLLTSNSFSKSVYFSLIILTSFLNSCFQQAICLPKLPFTLKHWFIKMTERLSTCIYALMLRNLCNKNRRNWL